MAYLDPSVGNLSIPATVAALQPLVAKRGLTLGQVSSAADSDAIAVTQATATKDHLVSIADLKPYASKWTFGGPPECATRITCVPGLQEVLRRGVQVVQVLGRGRAHHPHRPADGDVQAARIFSSDAVIAQDHFVVLTDPKDFQGAGNIIPVVRSGKATPAVLAVLNRVSAALTTADLVQFNLTCRVNHDDPTSVASQFVQSHISDPDLTTGHDAEIRRRPGLRRRPPRRDGVEPQRPAHQPDRSRPDARGVLQARRLGAALAGVPFDLVLCSPRRRAWRTAELAGLVPYMVDDDLQEWDYGELEGLTTSEIQEQLPGGASGTDRGLAVRHPTDVAARADRVIGRVLASGAERRTWPGRARTLQPGAGGSLGRRRGGGRPVAGPRHRNCVRPGLAQIGPGHPVLERAGGGARTNGSRWRAARAAYARGLRQDGGRATRSASGGAPCAYLLRPPGPGGGLGLPALQPPDLPGVHGGGARLGGSAPVRAP